MRTMASQHRFTELLVLDSDPGMKMLGCAALFLLLLSFLMIFLFKFKYLCAHAHKK